MVRISSSCDCWVSALSVFQVSKSRAIGPGFTLAVALMQPLPPPRMPRNRNVSAPAKTSKPPAEGLEKRLRVSNRHRNPSSGRLRRVRLEQPLDQAQRDRHLGHRRDVVDVHAQAQSPTRSITSEKLRNRPRRSTLVVEGRQHQHAPADQLTACAVNRTESGSAQQPVPGIMRPGSIPLSISRSSRSIRSSTESELASEFVPKTARPTFWESSHRHWRTKRSASGDRSAWEGRDDRREDTLDPRCVVHGGSLPCSRRRGGRRPARAPGHHGADTSERLRYPCAARAPTTSNDGTAGNGVPIARRRPVPAGSPRCIAGATAPRDHSRANLTFSM